MKRSTYTMVLAFMLGISTASQASACLCIPYIPWLDPFQWLGFYGCGGGYGGGGCGYGGCAGGYGGGYAPMATPSYGYGGYAPAAPMMSYPVAPATPGCSNCTGALPVPQQQQAMTAVQVPVTTYRAVTQYVPQTTYQTQYRPAAPAVAYQPQALGYQQAYGYNPAQTAYAAPVYGGGLMNPATAYNAPIPQTAMAPQYAAPQYANPYYPSPIAANPGGDVLGDHEWPTQSAQIPVYQNSHSGGVPARRASYGVPPQSARTFSATVK